MKGFPRFLRMGLMVTLSCGLALIVGGCGGPKDGETSPEIAKAQEGESSAWAKAKIEGKDKRTTARSPTNPGGRGFVNRPGS